MSARIAITLVVSIILLIGQVSVANADSLERLRAYTELASQRTNLWTNYVQCVATAKCKAADAELTQAKAANERIRGQQASLHIEWQEVELRELKRRLRQQRMREQSLERMGQRLASHRAELTAFLNGRINNSNAQAFLWSARHVPQSSHVVEFLSQDVGSIPGIEFKSHHPIFSSLHFDGSIRTPPAAMYTRNSNHPLAKAQGRFDRYWNGVLESLRYEGAIDGEQVGMGYDLLRRWELTFNEEPLLRSLSAKAAGRDYLNAMRRVVRSMESETGVRRLEMIANGTVTAFGGGRLGELLEHVQRWKLEVRSGSKAQMMFSQLGQELCVALDTEIASTNDSVAHVRAKSVSTKDAAIHQAILNKSLTKN